MSEKEKQMTHVAFIIDSSGSMQSLREFVVSTFNEQLETLAAEVDENTDVNATMCFFSYANNIIMPRWEEDITSVSKLSAREYKPDGNTALFDAIGLTVDKLMKLPDADSPNSSFLVMILTDGQENASVKYNHQQIKDLFTKLQATDRWTFTYYGTEPAKVSAQFNIPVQNTMAWDQAQFVSGSYTVAAGAATKEYMSARKMGHTSSSNFYNSVKDSNVLQDTLIKLNESEKEEKEVK